MPRQPDIGKIQDIYERVTGLQLELCSVLDGPPTGLRADSAALLRVLEDFYQQNLYPRLVKRG
jgi:hypothetical protein